MKKDIPEFGIKRENEERRDGGCAVIFDPVNQKYAVGMKENGWFIIFGGGVDETEDIQEGVLREVREESGLYDFLYVEKIAEAMCHFRNYAKGLNRIAHATCFLVVLKSAGLKPVQHEEHEKFVLDWATAEEILSNFNLRNKDDYPYHWDYFFKKSVNRAIELGYDKLGKNYSNILYPPTACLSDRQGIIE